MPGPNPGITSSFALPSDLSAASTLHVAPAESGRNTVTLPPREAFTVFSFSTFASLIDTTTSFVSAGGSVATVAEGVGTGAALVTTGGATDAEALAAVVVVSFLSQATRARERRTSARMRGAL